VPEERDAGDAPPAGAAPPEEDELRRGYARGRARDEAIRAGLEPLGPGERPLGLKLAAVLAAAISLANLAVLAGGWGSSGSRVAGLVFAAALAALACGLWQRRYIAVLIFEALLAVSIIYAALSLAFASNLAGVLLPLSVLALAAPVFWLLVRIMARLQLPRR
jgi:hypothetical protein